MTGDCYEAAFTVMHDASPEVRKWMRLCHGIATGQSGEAEGLRIGHAWVTLAGSVVIDTSNGGSYTGRRERYYRLGAINADEVAEYTYEQASRLALETGTYGPFHDTGDAVHRNEYESLADEREHMASLGDPDLMAERAERGES